MLTTHQLVQSATSSFLPWLLLLIAWYAIAASIRAFVDLFLRYRRKWKIEKQIERRLEDVARVKAKRQEVRERTEASPTIESYAGEMEYSFDEDTAPLNWQKLSQKVPQISELLEDIEVLETILKEELQESLLLGHQVDGRRRLWIWLEGFLFAALAVLAMFQALPLPKTVLTSAPWLHVVGPLTFLCFVLKARRLLMLIPLTILSLISWQAFSFITSFQQTLEATTTVAIVEVDEVKKRKGSNRREVTFRVKFSRGNVKHKLTMPLGVNKELRFDAISYRVPSEVLLFGGKNLLTLQSAFTDGVPSSKAVALHKPDEPFPLYGWDGIKRRRRRVLEKQKKLAFVWLWKQLFNYHKAHKTDDRSRWQKRAVTCPPPKSPPLQAGQKYLLKHRHVAGIECHLVASPKKPVVKTTGTNPPTVVLPPISPR